MHAHTSIETNFKFIVEVDFSPAPAILGVLMDLDLEISHWEYKNRTTSKRCRPFALDMRIPGGMGMGRYHV